MVAGDSKLENGWLYFAKVGVYGTSYRQRAMVTWYGFGANITQDAVYPIAEGPDAPKKYSGEHKYVVHIPKGQMPPVKGFWSLTMYDKDYFFVPNPLNRYTLSQPNKLKSNADGSVDLYLQHESPGKGKEENWLPARPLSDSTNGPSRRRPLSFAQSSASRRRFDGRSWRRRKTPSGKRTAGSRRLRSLPNLYRSKFARIQATVSNRYFSLPEDYQQE